MDDRTGGDGVTTIDFAAILDAAFNRSDAPYPTANILAAKVPQACQATHMCAGYGNPCSHLDNPATHDPECPFCPTIGQMLREHQALTALAEYAQHDEECVFFRRVGDGCRDASCRVHACTCGLDAARAALEAVRT